MKKLTSSKRIVSRTTFFLSTLVITHSTIAQNKDAEIIASFVKEATTNSQLQTLGHQLIDFIGPRMVGTPQMQQAHDWAVKTYTDWGITARNENWGQWRGWERGVTTLIWCIQE